MPMPEPQRPETSPLPVLIGRAAGILSSDGFPTGDRARLRRMAPNQPPPLAFTRFALSHLAPGWEHQADDWAVLLAGLAIMAPHAHRPDRGLGRALAEAGYSETRLERLLNADGDTQRTLLLRAARFLAARTSPFNWTDAARLLLSREEGLREQIRRRIAHDFFSNLNTERPAT